MKRPKIFVWAVIGLTLYSTISSDPTAHAQLWPYYQDATCGANCLYAVCRLKSINTTLEQVVQFTGITTKGTSMLKLVEASKKLGLHPRPLKTTVNKLQAEDAFAIIHVKQNHFVLCVGWREDDLVIVDPPKDPYLMNKKDLKDQWTGYVLLFDKKKDINESPSQRPFSSEEDIPQQSSHMSNTDNNTGQTPEMVRNLLAAINKQKRSRDEIRGLHEMLNKSAPEIKPNSWLNCEPIKLEDLKGKIVFLDFWSMGCGACVGSIKDMNKLFNWAQSKPIQMIGLHAYTDNIAQVKQFMAEKGIRYPICIDSKSNELSDGRTFEQYRVHGLPRQFLIDIHGRIRSIETVVGPTIEKLLEESADGELHTTEYDIQARYGVNVVPKMVIFGTVSMSSQTEKKVYIYKPDDPTFVVRIESAPDAPAAAQLFRYEQEDALLYELRILFSTDLQVENYSSEIKLTTNDIHKPKIIIPVTASIASEEHRNLSAGNH
ncbi:MAG: cysteine peptidase family C39 domain-containing protein [Phycisphaerae bacterium]|nr:cysteine peptidase family C39 domain-containing protein [Phycisphaerae bacterium]